jgi:DNA gyrase/topoisomerase IV subunit A
MGQAYLKTFNQPTESVNMLMIKQGNPKAKAFLASLTVEVDALIREYIRRSIHDVEGEYVLVNAEEVALTALAASISHVGRIIEVAKEVQDNGPKVEKFCVAFTYKAIELAYPPTDKSGMH